MSSPEIVVLWGSCTSSRGGLSGNRLDQLRFPFGICVGEGERSLLVADMCNNRVMQWQLGSEQGAPLAHEGLEGLNHPWDVARWGA